MMVAFPSTLTAALATARARFALRRCASVGEAPVVVGRVWIHGEGSVRLGHRVRLEARGVPIELHAAEGAEIRIGDDVVIEGGTSIEALESVTIGARTRLCGLCKVLDNAFHVPGSAHLRPASAPVVVEDDAWIGRRSIVLPGARVRSGTTVRAGSVLRARAGPRAQTTGGRG